MKKLMLCFVLAASVAIGFSSCAKESCYQCTQTNSSGSNSVTTTSDVCEGQVVTTTESGGSSASTTGSLGGSSAEDYKNNLEASGFTCTEK